MELLKEYDLEEEPRNLIDALVINFEFAQIQSYVNNMHQSYQRVRIFLVICYKLLERLDKGVSNEESS